jgi:hypothetical protein
VRIAVSGTHCSGKSTLIDDFLRAHPDYAHEPEPYEWLEEHGEASAEEPDAESFYRQLEISVDRLSTYDAGTNVIAERSPLDFLAYLLALNDLGRSARDCDLITRATDLAALGLAHLDLLILLPLTDSNPIAAPASEDLELREAMNEQLIELVTTNPYALLTRETLRVIELHGTPQQRLIALERVVAERT